MGVERNDQAILSVLCNTRFPPIHRSEIHEGCSNIGLDKSDVVHLGQYFFLCSACGALQVSRSLADTTMVHRGFGISKITAVSLQNWHVYSIHYFNNILIFWVVGELVVV